MSRYRLEASLDGVLANTVLNCEAHRKFIKFWIFVKQYDVYCFSFWHECGCFDDRYRTYFSQMLEVMSLRTTCSVNESWIRGTSPQVMTDFNPSSPHPLAPLPPSVEIETRPVLRACIEARATLAALDQAAQHIPNPAVLINTLPLLEAADSSRIENIVTTTDALFRFVATNLAGADPATREALRYRTALYDGFVSLTHRPVSTATAVTVCSTIKNTDMLIRRIPGTQIVRQDTNEVIYTPPVGEEVLRDHLKNWERFMHRSVSVDPLIRMALCHYQFEAIHPFTDGNGRTGRILNLLFLVNMNLLRLPVLYLSRYIIENKADYYRLLNEVTSKQAWEPWTLFMLEAVRDTAGWTLAKIDAITILQQATIAHVRSTLPSTYRYELIELLFTQPYCRIRNLVEAEIGGRQSAARWLQQLVDVGVLEERRAGKERLFINIRLMGLLTEPGNQFPVFA